MEPHRSLLAQLFISPDERRLRAGWRLLVHLLIFLGVFFIAGLGWILLTRLAGEETGLGFVESQVLTAIAITLSIFIARRFVDRRPFASLGLHLDRKALSQAVRELLAGFLIAAVMMLLVYLILRLAGWLSVTNLAWQVSPLAGVLLGLMTMLGAFIVVGWQEELYFRGYLLQNLRDGLNPAWAVGLSSLIFGLAHLMNPNWSWLGFAGLILAGLFMAFGYLRTRRLWLPVGLHIGWNFFEGPVLGFAVSGLNTFRLFETRVSGPEVITGGAFGPEAGLVLLPALALGTFLIWLTTRRSRSSTAAEIPGEPTSPTPP